MPISSAAVSGEFFPTPFITHKTQSGQPIESARTVTSSQEIRADLNTLDDIPSTEKTVKRAGFANSTLCKVTMGLLVTVMIAGITGAILGVMLTKSNNTINTASTSTTAITATTKTDTTSTSVTTTSVTTTSSTSTSTITTVTTTSTTTVSTTTTTTTLTLLASTNETIYALWNTVVGGNSTLATAGTGAGNYVAAENPPNALDRNTSTKYNAYGSCGAIGSSSPTCGVNTGLYLTLSRGSSLLQSFRFCAANDIPSRDPMTVTIEGSNQPSSSLLTGSSWTPIYNGTTGLDTDPGRYTYGVRQNISNSAWYTSYRLLITSVRTGERSTQYAEIELTGY